MRDRAPGNLSDARNLRKLRPRNRRFNDFVSLDDQNDVFRFKLKKSSNVVLKLKRLRENASLEVFETKRRRRRVLNRIGNHEFGDLNRRQIRRNLKRVGRSNRRGRRNEKIKTELDKGIYYIRVSYSQRNGDGTRYRLLAKGKPISDVVDDGTSGSPGGDTVNPGSGGSGGSSGGSDSGSGGGSGGSEVASWVRQFGSGANDYAYGVDVDSAGNVYLAGTTEGSLPGRSSSGDRDNFVAKYDKNGTLQWRRQFGTTDDDIIFDIAVEDSGDYYVAGVTVSDPDFFAGDAGIDGFLAKYDSDGNQLWTANVPDANRLVDITTDVTLIANVDAGDAFSSIEIDASGTVFVAGFTQAVPQTILSTALGDVTFNESPARAFVARYDSATGANDWFSEFNGTDSSGFSDLKLDASGNVYATGIDGATLQDDIDSPFTGGDALLTKFGANGSLLFSEELAATEANAQDYARSIAIDDTGHIYITGDTQGSLDGSSAGETDGFVAKYDASGSRFDLQWVRQFGTSESDESQAIAIADDGTVYVSGETAGDLYGSLLGVTDIWLAAYDSTGTLNQSNQFGTAQAEEVYRMTTDSANRPYLVGQTRGSLQSGVSNVGSYDVWVYKQPPSL